MPCERSWPPFCIPSFTSDGLNVYFYALTAHFGYWLAGSRRGRIVQKTAGGSKADLRPGEEKLLATQAGTGHTGDEALNSGRSHSRLTELRLLWTTEHGVHRAGESERPTWCGRSRTPHLGHG